MIRRNDNIQMLEDTLQIFSSGKYNKDGKTIHTKLSKKQMEECYVYLPENVADICNRKDFEHVHVMGRVGVGCQNVDSFSMAQMQYKHFSYLFSGKKEKNVLVCSLKLWENFYISALMKKCIFPAMEIFMPLI